ncbi:hypothetical protein AC249_AIPGENE13845 [Exaiptasia diaphana]|nr:hypothetical protein AC249_AIPGENE13845 [Exaiptasia diaphana]
MCLNHITKRGLYRIRCALIAGEWRAVMNMENVLLPCAANDIQLLLCLFCEFMFPDFAIVEDVERASSTTSDTELDRTLLLRSSRCALLWAVLMLTQSLPPPQSMLVNNVVGGNVSVWKEGLFRAQH